MEAPRLSTIQALLLLLKAREATPKKGYYYRSWQTVKTMVTMAKDLEIHEHYSFHNADKPCGLCPVECLVQTRVWQTLLVVEIMIGGAQGTYSIRFPIKKQNYFLYVMLLTLWCCRSF